MYLFIIENARNKTQLRKNVRESLGKTKKKFGELEHTLPQPRER